LKDHFVHPSNSFSSISFTLPIYLVPFRSRETSSTNFLEKIRPPYFENLVARFVATTWSIARHLTPAKHARQARYCPRREMKIYVCQPLCRKVRVFGRVERNSLVSQQPEPRPEAHCLRIGVISRISVFKRIPTRDSRLAKTFFTLRVSRSLKLDEWSFAKKRWRFFFYNTVVYSYIANVKKNREQLQL